MTVERLWVYQDTARQDFPLVLVLGREGNNSGPMRDAIGEYDWNISRSSGQWNKSYGFIARIMGVGTGAMLKSIANEKHGSPVVFSNVSPLPLTNDIRNKDDYRRTVRREDVEDNASIIFRLSDRELGSRYAAVIFSTGPDKDFSLRRAGIEAFGKECSGRGIPLFEIPYLGKQGGSTAEYDQAIDPAAKRALGERLRSFL